MQDTVATPWGRASGQETPAVHIATPQPHHADGLYARFFGRKGRLFWLALKTGFLTVLTLGIYRFWMKTRMRRWYWSSVRIGKLPLEYVGDPFEKLLGFLIAVVILAFYIGVVNLVLMFASFSLFQGNFAAYLLSFIGVIPLWFYAQYRSRRYVLARTRWRGLRFGLAPGAWGYALRALLYWALALVSVGLLWPLKTFKLEQYRTDRTYFGDHQMKQDGRWTMLYPAMKWLFIAAALGGACAVWIAVSPDASGAVGGMVLAGIMALYGIAYFRVESLTRLTNTKRLGDVRLTLHARPRKVLAVYLFGYLLAGLAVVILLMAGGFAILALTGLDSWDFSDGLPDISGVPRGIVVALSVMLYFSMFLMWSALTHVLITMPLFRHYTNGLRVMNEEALDQIRQRPRDEHTEAEGFAEALDVGASL